MAMDLLPLHRPLEPRCRTFILYFCQPLPDYCRIFANTISSMFIPSALPPSTSNGYGAPPAGDVSFLLNYFCCRLVFVQSTYLYNICL